jgi:hypothetical protein
MRIEHVVAACVAAGGGDGKLVALDDGRDPVAHERILDPDPPGEFGAGTPDQAMSPPALTAKSANPARPSIAAAWSIDQPLTSPEGSRRPSAYASK